MHSRWSAWFGRACATTLCLTFGCSTEVSAPASASSAVTAAPLVPPLPAAAAAPRVVPAAYRDAMRRTITELDARLGLAPYLAFDRNALALRASSLLETGGASLDEGYFLAATALLRAYPVGHLVFYPENEAACGSSALPKPTTSLLGACTQPYLDHAVVSAVMTGNPLGLVPGDEIVAVDGVSGDAMMGRVLDHPMCGASGSPSASHRRAIAATTLLATIPVGSQIAVKHVNGAVETKTVTTLTPPLSCADPFAREGGFAARATMRPDGVGVIHVPSFYPSDYDEADAAGSVTRFENAIRAEIAKVKNAPFVVIDVRGNTGGFSYVAMELAGGLPGASARTVSRCDTRTASTNQYGELTVSDVVLGMGFDIAGKVAVLGDGLSFSATDMFLHAARYASNALVVGRPSGGAFGSSQEDIHITGGPGLHVYVDTWRCVDEVGQLLEGRSVQPHVAIDLSPAALAYGVDSDLEAAVRRLRQ